MLTSLQVGNILESKLNNNLEMEVINFIKYKIYILLSNIMMYYIYTITT